MISLKGFEVIEVDRSCPTDRMYLMKTKIPRPNLEDEYIGIPWFLPEDGLDIMINIFKIGAASQSDAPDPHGDIYVYFIRHPRGYIGIMSSPYEHEPKT